MIRITVRRTKDEAGTSTGSGSMTDERLEWHLWNWRTWMYSGKTVEGYPMASAGLRSIGQSDFDDMAEASDIRCARACNAIVEGLPPAQAAAVYRKWLHAVYRFPRGNFECCLAMAMDTIRAGLESRGIW